jgi:hypothetical protein
MGSSLENLAVTPQLKLTLKIKALLSFATSWTSWTSWTTDPTARCHIPEDLECSAAQLWEPRMLVVRLILQVNSLHGHFYICTVSLGPPPQFCANQKIETKKLNICLPQALTWYRKATAVLCVNDEHGERAQTCRGKWKIWVRYFVANSVQFYLASVIATGVTLGQVKLHKLYNIKHSIKLFYIITIQNLIKILSIWICCLKITC